MKTISDKKLVFYKCGYCFKTYRRLGVWLFNHFEKKHKGKTILIDRKYKGE